MLHPVAFFAEPRIHSRRKHRLLRKYLPPWAAKLGRYERVIYCVDGFAGPGQYEDSDDDGSPLMMARLIDAAASWQTPRELRVIAVEKDPGLCNKLKTLVTPWMDRGAMSVRCAAFTSVLPSILGEIGGAPAYFFLDPYSQKALPLPLGLAPILARLAPTDVSLMYFGPGLHRMASRLCEAPIANPTVAKAAASTLARVDQIVGGAGWREGFCEIGGTTQQIERLEQHYLKGALDAGFAYGSYPIRPGLRRSAVYEFVHIARHRDAFLLMSDCVFDEGEELHREMGEESAQEFLPGFGDEGREETRREDLRTLILGALRLRPASQEGLREEILIKQRRFGDFHSRDFTAVRRELVSTGFITQARSSDLTKNKDTVWRLADLA
jgi:three-Cys-motif partner protein